MKYLILLIFLFQAHFTISQNACALFKVVSIYDVPANPDQNGGNYFVLLLTVTEDLNSSFDPFYTTLYFIDAIDNHISETLGGGFTLPQYATDTIPYLMKILSDDSNLDFPKDEETFLVFNTTNSPPNPTDCTIAVSNNFTSNIDDSDKSNISIFPNPVRDQLKIEGLKIKEISIWDELGRVVFYEKEIKSNSVFLGHLKSGLYIAKCIGEDGSNHTESFVKVD